MWFESNTYSCPDHCHWNPDHVKSVETQAITAIRSFCWGYISTLTVTGHIWIRWCMSVLVIYVLTAKVRVLYRVPRPPRQYPSIITSIGQNLADGSSDSSSDPLLSQYILLPWTSTPFGTISRIRVLLLRRGSSRRTVEQDLHKSDLDWIERVQRVRSLWWSRGPDLSWLFSFSGMCQTKPKQEGWRGVPLTCQCWTSNRDRTPNTDIDPAILIMDMTSLNHDKTCRIVRNMANSRVDFSGHKPMPRVWCHGHLNFGTDGFVTVVEGRRKYIRSVGTFHVTLLRTMWVCFRQII
jgi:hypothetical protein